MGGPAGGEETLDLHRGRRLAAWFFVGTLDRLGLSQVLAGTVRGFQFAGDPGVRLHVRGLRGGRRPGPLGLYQLWLLLWQAGGNVARSPGGGCANSVGFVFEGATKKASYEGGLAGRKTFPIQAITAVINVTIGLSAAELIVHRRFVAGYLVAVVGSQVWRFISETMRADHRGRGRVSAYQYMAIFSSLYAVAIASWFPIGAPRPAARFGLAGALASGGCAQSASALAGHRLVHGPQHRHRRPSQLLCRSRTHLICHDIFLKMVQITQKSIELVHLPKH